MTSVAEKGHKEASRVSPARFEHPDGKEIGTHVRAGPQDAGNRTVSITWITPFD
jgi:hypothetical protein